MQSPLVNLKGEANLNGEGWFPLRQLISEERERCIREAMRVRNKRDREEVKKKRDHVRKKREGSYWQRNRQERIDNQREERETKLKSIFIFLEFGTVPFQIWNGTVHMLAFIFWNRTIHMLEFGTIPFQIWLTYFLPIYFTS